VIHDPTVDQALSNEEVAEVLRRFRGARVWVVGDLLLDEYIDGEVKRISPEAPVPVVSVQRTYNRLGGAANVANCLAALGADVRLCGVIGDDDAGGTLLSACAEVGIDTAAIVRMDDRPTGRKVRVVSHHQQLLRLDWERIAPVPDHAFTPALAALESGEGPDVLLLSDYGKGLLTDSTLARLMAWAASRGVPVLVDPKRTQLAAYAGASVITPNLREFAAMVGDDGVEVDLQRAADAARAQLASAQVASILVTLGERGVLVVPAQGPARQIQATAREVFDVTGAGDTLVAVLALGLAAGAELLTAARIANAAAGVVVGKFGTAVVHLPELVEALSARPADKVYTAEQLDQQVGLWRHRGRRVVFTNGCFDVLHAGHLAMLRFSASHGDELVVGINDDDSVRRLKGPTRPLVAQAERAALVAALDCVSAVVLFSEDTPAKLIERVLPGVLVKGADYSVDQVVGADVVQAAGGQVVLAPLVAGRSTTGLIHKLRE